MDNRMGSLAYRYHDPHGVMDMTYAEIKYWYGWHKIYLDAELAQVRKYGRK
jgi:hypothetical protein